MTTTAADNAANTALDCMDVDCEWDESDDALAASAYDASMVDDFVLKASTFVWKVPSLRTGQQKASRFLFNPATSNSIIVCQRTGAGKTHLVRTVGVCVRGIILIFIPLLTLSADVLAKFMTADQQYGTVEVQHLDELHENAIDKYHSFLRRCKALLRNTTSTIFVFMSPQFMVNAWVGINLHDSARTRRRVPVSVAQTKSN